MKSIVAPIAVVGLLGTIVGLTAAGGGCKDDSCTKDTDCEMPYVCIKSACVPVGTVVDVPVTDVPADVPEADGEAPAADGDADGDEGAIEVPEDGEAPDDGVEDDAGGGCRPVTSAPFNIVERAADGDERPVSLRSGAGFVFFGRPPGPVAADGLRFQRVNLDGSAAGVAMWTLSSVEISPFHPLVELPSGSFATAFEVPEGAGPGIWIKIVPSSGTGGEVPRQVPGTNGGSGEPTLTFDGTDLVVAWTHTEAGMVEIRAQHFVASTGVAIGEPVTVAVGPSGTREPRIAWGTTRHALAYFDGSDGALHVVMLDGTLAETAEYTIGPPTGHSLIGYPSLVWNGTEFGLAWETRGTVSARLHLATFMPDAEPEEHDVLSDVPLSGTELGQVSLAWGDRTNEWGLAWRYTQTSRVSIALARIDAVDFHRIAGPVDIRPESTTAWHPSLAYNNGFYMVSWIEQSGTNYPIYEATHGCTPTP